jgi:hypothetical protein
VLFPAPLTASLAPLAGDLDHALAEGAAERLRPRTLRRDGGQQDPGDRQSPQ